MAKAKHVLAIDQGTTGTHVSILDARLQVAGKAYREFTQHFPKPGLGGARPGGDLGVRRVLHRAALCKDAGLKGTDIAAIGITNQRETTGLWTGGTGKPLAPRHRLAGPPHRRRLRAAQGQGRGAAGPRDDRAGARPLLLRHQAARGCSSTCKGARDARGARATLCFGTIDTWLVYKLTGGAAHVTDVSNASRTLLMDLRTLRVGRRAARAVRRAAARAAGDPRLGGGVRHDARAEERCPDGIPVAGMAGDQQAALFGQACFAPGESKCTYGTGAFLLMNTGETPVRSKAGLLTTVAWKLGERTTLRAGGQRLHRRRGGAVAARRAQGHQAAPPDIEALAREVKDTGEVVFVPGAGGAGRAALAARGARACSRASTAPPRRRTWRARCWRASRCRSAIWRTRCARTAGGPIPAFKVDGGAAANGLLMQFQADMLDTPVVRPRNLETTSLGAAFLGGLGAGVWSSPEAIRRAWKAERTFKPKMKADVRERHLAKWKRAVERA